MAWITSANPRGSHVDAKRDIHVDRSAIPSSRWVRFRQGDLVIPLVWLSAGFHGLLLAQKAVPVAAANSGHHTTAPGSDPLALAAVLSGLMVAVVLMRRSSIPRVLTRFAGASDGITRLGSEVSVARSATAPDAQPASLSVIARPRETSGLLTWSVLSQHVSHELRTPLNAVIGFADVMHRELHGPVGNARYREYLAHIHASSEALLKATEDTLAVTALLADPTPRQSAVLGLSACVAEARERTARIERPAEGCAAHWAIDIPPDVAVEVEPRAFRQALANLLIAAKRHAGPNGQIMVLANASHGVVALDIKAVPKTGEELQAAVAEGDAMSLTGGEHFPLSLAHALLELQGCELAEARRGPALVLTTMLTEAAQHDMALFD